MGRALLVFLVFAAAAAGLPPGGNEAHYLTKARHFWDPRFGAGDFFLGTRDAHVVFYWLAGWVTTLVPLETAAWIGRACAWALLAWAWVRLCDAVAPRARAGTVVAASAAWVAGVDLFDLAGEWVVGGFEAKPLAYALVLFGLEAIVRARWNRAWPLLGAATAVHVLVGGWSAAFAGVVWLTDASRPPLARMAPALVLGLCLALPGLVPAALLDAGAPEAIRDQANRIYVFERLPHHLAPTLLPAGEQAVRFARHAVVAVAFAALVLTVPLGAGQRRLRTWIFCAAGAAALGLAISATAPLAPSAPARLLRYYWFRLNDVALPLGVALFSMHGLAMLRTSRSGAARAASAALSVLLAAYVVTTVAERAGDPRPAAEHDLASQDAWVDACAWIAAHTPEDARFLTPSEAQTFVWRTGRAQVVTEKDVPQDAAGIVEWRARMDDVHAGPAGAGGGRGTAGRLASLADLGAARLLTLGSRYGARFVLTSAHPPLDLPRVFANEAYAVYDLERARRAPSAPGAMSNSGS